jgi:hypothetical protein
MNPSTNLPGALKLLQRLLIILFLLNFISCTDSGEDGKVGTYVKPSVDYKGKVRRGHFRRPVSTSKHAIKNRNRSKYYYETRGKYRRRKKKDD